MNEALEALYRMIYNGYVHSDCKELKIIENELKEYEQHKAIENELGIDLVTYFTVKKRGYIYYRTLDGTIRESKVWAQFFGYDWCWYIRSPKKNDRRRVRMRHYGTTWALDRKELE